MNLDMFGTAERAPEGAITRDLYYIDDYNDEILPCSPTMEGWAAWLSNPDPTWHRDAPAQDGETFRASHVRATHHRVTCDDDGLTITPPLAPGYSFLAETFGLGRGWEGDSFADDEDELEERFEPGSSGTIAACYETEQPIEITYHAAEPSCTWRFVPKPS